VTPPLTAREAARRLTPFERNCIILTARHGTDKAAGMLRSADADEPGRSVGRRQTVDPRQVAAAVVRARRKLLGLWSDRASIEAETALGTLDLFTARVDLLDLNVRQRAEHRRALVEAWYYQRGPGSPSRAGDELQLTRELVSADTRRLAVEGRVVPTGRAVFDFERPDPPRGRPAGEYRHSLKA